MTTHTHTVIYTYIPHATGQSLIQSHGMFRGLTEVYERLLVPSLRQMIKKHAKEEIPLLQLLIGGV